MLTIGYIGNGKSTNRYHLPFARKVEGIRIKSIYHRSQPKWQTFEEIHYTTDLDEILQDPEIDLIVITTYSDSHYHFAKLVLEAGKHALVEKPFTHTVNEARELFQLAKAKGLMLQAFQNRRFDSDYLTTLKVIESGKLGDILELEMHFDYFRPEIPENIHEFKVEQSYLYGHACHTLDQVIAYFGKADHIHYDVRQLLGPNRMNDYFDIDLYYGNTKVSVKSSYFRIKTRPSFVVYGTKGMFIKEKKDRQEEHLKHFYMPDNPDFGLDLPEDYGTLTYIDSKGNYHEEKVVSEVGDYSRFYQNLYDTIVNGAPKTVSDDETLYQLEILEAGIESMIHQ